MWCDTLVVLTHIMMTRMWCNKAFSRMLYLYPSKMP